MSRALDVLGARIPATPDAGRPWRTAATIAGGLLGVVLFPRHRVVSGLAGLALGRNAYRLARREETAREAAENIVPVAAASVAAIVVSPLAPVAYGATYLATSAAMSGDIDERLRSARAALRDVRVDVAGLIGAGGYTDRATVEAVQKKLLADGAHLPAYGADGNYGKETADAIKFWRKAHGWDEGSGEIDDRLLSDMGLGRPRATKATAGPLATSPPQSAAPASAGILDAVPPWKLAVGAGGAAVLLTGIALLVARAARAAR